MMADGEERRGNYLLPFLSVSAQFCVLLVAPADTISGHFSQIARRIICNA